MPVYMSTHTDEAAYLPTVYLPTYLLLDRVVLSMGEHTWQTYHTHIHTHTHR